MPIACRRNQRRGLTIDLGFAYATLPGGAEIGS